VLDRFKVKDVIMAVPLMMLLSYGLLAIIDHPASCVFLFAVAVLLAMFYPTQSEIMNRRIPVESRAILLAFKGQLMSFGIMIVFPIMGWISERSSLSTAFLVLISLALPVLLALTLRLRTMELQCDVPSTEPVGMSQ
jgi:MFS family permease